ncbi:hypothetical protein H4R19_006943, partial [Coemansia spiralis]
HLAKFLVETAEDLVKPLERKWTTDRQAQYMYRAVLCPTMAYKVQGLPLKAAELTATMAPLMHFVKHKFGIPLTERWVIEMMLRLVNRIPNLCLTKHI